MADLTLTPEDREAIRSILQAERDAGNPLPLLPADVDLDGDEICDAFGLDAFGQVCVVPGVRLAGTLYESTGGQ